MKKSDLISHGLLAGAVLVFSAIVACSGNDSAPGYQEPDQRVGAEREKGETGSGGKNAKQHQNKPIVLMISIDGFRADYLTHFQPPHLGSMAQKGVRSIGMEPSFPTLTFPNHITLMTGRPPGRHGIVSNRFFDEARRATYSMGDGKAVNDGSWYGADALWTIAERQKMVSAIFFWVGSEAKIGGLNPYLFKHYDGSIANSTRTDQIMDWLDLPEENRPHLLGLYFSDVDSAGHKYGPDSMEVKRAIMEIDEEIGRLNAFVERKKLPVNFVVVSDHGMEKLESDKVITLSDYTDMSGFTIGDRGPVVNMYSDDPKKVDRAFIDLKRAENHFRVYRRNQVPKQYMYDHASRVGDLVVIADLPYYIYDQNFSGGAPKLNSATHGWPQENPSMHALFIAKGPQVREGATIPTFSNLHVFPFVAEILELPIPASVEGDPAVLRPYRR